MYVLYTYALDVRMTDLSEESCRKASSHSGDAAVVTAHRTFGTAYSVSLKIKRPSPLPPKYNLMTARIFTYLWERKLFTLDVFL